MMTRRPSPASSGGISSSRSISCADRRSLDARGRSGRRGCWSRPSASSWAIPAGAGGTWRRTTTAGRIRPRHRSRPTGWTARRAASAVGTRTGGLRRRRPRRSSGSHRPRRPCPPATRLHRCGRPSAPPRTEEELEGRGLGDGRCPVMGSDRCRGSLGSLEDAASRPGMAFISDVSRGRAERCVDSSEAMVSSWHC